DCIVFSPDSTKLLTASADLSADIWDASSGAEVAVIQLNDPLVGVAFSVDGSSVVGMTADGRLNVWDSWTGAHLRSQPGRPTTTYITCAGNRIVTLDASGSFAIWDPRTLSLEFEGREAQTTAAPLVSDLGPERNSPRNDTEYNEALRLYSQGK